MKKYKVLTDYISKFVYDENGIWIYNERNNETTEDGQIPKYQEIIFNFIDDIHNFVEFREDINLNNYQDILRKNNIKWEGHSIQEADIENLDEVAIIALILGAVRLERFCQGYLLGIISNGTIRKWLKRLEQLDN